MKLRLLCLFCASVLLSGCYYIQAATGQMGVMSKRRPIAQVIEDPRTPQQLKTRLEYVTQAREFASRVLKLPDNDSYRSFADLGRRFVVWNVFATEEFSVEPRRWCFPIAGCVVYRGYFDDQRALAYANRLDRRGYDVSVGGVAAYSTLGHFDDPVLNTMLGWSDAQLAGTLFHELAHQVVYVPGDSDFNEGFATVVEEAGLERWLSERNASHEWNVWHEQRERRRHFVELLLETRERLRQLYASNLPEDAMRAQKQVEFARLKLKYEALKREWKGYAGYDAWFSQTLNNAHLVSAATYHSCVAGLQELLRKAGYDFEQFYATARTLAEPEHADERAALCAEQKE